jgi:hypothetical protein
MAFWRSTVLPGGIDHWDQNKPYLFEIMSCNVSVMWRYTSCNIYITFMMSHVSWRRGFVQVDVVWSNVKWCYFLWLVQVCCSQWCYVSAPKRHNNFVELRQWNRVKLPSWKTIKSRTYTPGIWPLTLKKKRASKESVQMAQDQFLAFCRPTGTRILPNPSDNKSVQTNNFEHASIRFH